MSVIVPAILPRTFADLQSKLSQLEGVADAVQIDVVDGVFAQPASWPYGEGSKEFADLVARGDLLPHVGSLQFEIDLMVSDPESVTGMWLSVGASRLTLHVESSTYMPRLITDLQTKYGHSKDFAPDLLSLGLAINIETELGIIEPFLSLVDYIQFMGISSIGHQGESFDKRVLQKIAIFKKQHPDIAVQVDGGVSLETAPALLSAGVDRLIVGSALWKADNLKKRFEELTALSSQYGLFA